MANQVSTPGFTPADVLAWGNLAVGEVAFRFVDRKVYIKHSTANVGLDLATAGFPELVISSTEIVQKVPQAEVTIPAPATP